MENTTAKQRELARLYESQCDWGNAAQCWQAAHDLYPNQPGELSKSDKQQLAQRAQECRRAAKKSD